MTAAAPGRRPRASSSVPGAAAHPGSPPSHAADPAPAEQAVPAPTGPSGAGVPLPGPTMSGPDASDHPGAVLFDRDDTLIVDVPYNGDPRRVRLMPGAREALRLLRARRIPVGVVSNQSGIGRGLLTEAAVLEVNARVDALLGTPLDVWLHCPHLPEDGCGCRKPAPGLILEAAWRLGVEPGRCAVIGDIGTDMDAARAAGARGVLVPTTRTLPAEVAAAPDVCRDLLGAVRHLLGHPSTVRRPL